MNALDRFNRWINRAAIAAGGLFLVAMGLLTCANIVSRGFWVPIQGTYELMGYFGAVVVALALAHTQLRRGHIAVDVLITRFSERRRRVLTAVNGLVCMALFGLAARQLVQKALVLRASGELTETLRIIYYPFALVVALGCLLLALVLLAEFFRALGSGAAGGGAS
jgi:TRAP-type C4-dicarboxylate transport system permease small subunit